MKTAVIYARYSSDRQTEQSIEGQVHVCNDYAQRNDILIVGSYIDRATTGTNDNREQFQQMLKDSDKKAWDIVLVYKLDRFSRNKYEMAIHRKRLKDNGIKIISAMENIPETPEGIILESLLEGMSEYYSRELSQKTSRGMRETRLKGLHGAGRLNYGYYIEPKKDNERKRNGKVLINEEEAAVVREIYTRYNAGERCMDVVRDLTARGIFYRGKPFIVSTLYTILRAEKYTGRYEIHGEVYNNIYPPIIPPEVYETARKKIEANKYGKHVPDESYLLHGKAACGLCGHNLTSYSGTSKSGRLFRYYKCWNATGKRNCQAKFIKKDVLDNIVIDALKNITDGKNLAILVEKLCIAHNANLQKDNPLKTLERELVNVNKSLANIMMAIESGIITETTKERLQELEATKKSLQEKLIAERIRERVAVTPVEVENYIKHALKENPALMINLLVEKVYVYPEKIEIIIKYTTTPKRPPNIANSGDKDDKAPEDIKSLRGTFITDTIVQYKVYSALGLRKGTPPKFRSTAEMPAFIYV